MVNLKDAPPPPEFDGEKSLNLATSRPHSPRLGPSRSDIRREFSRLRSLSEARSDIRRESSRLRSLSEAGSVVDRSRRLRFSSSTEGDSEGASLSILAGGSRRNRFSSRSMPDPIIPSESDSEEEINESVSHKDNDEEEGDPISEEDGARPRVYSDGSPMTDFDDDDDTLHDFEMKRRAPSTLDTGPRQRYICGRPLPLWCTTKPTSTEMARCLAKYMPCFWCSSLSLTTTNQAILLRLNTLTAFFALVQLASASFLASVLFSENLLDRRAFYVDRGRSAELVNTPNLWSVNGSILAAGCLGVFTFLGMLWSRRSLREIHLPGMLRFMWFMYWIIPIEVYLFVSMFDYHNATNTWIRHWWAAEATAWFRSKTCAGGTYQTLCVVPIDGLPLFTTADEWCEFYYNSTACQGIRDDAQATTVRLSYFFYYMNGAVGIFVFLLVRTHGLCLHKLCLYLLCLTLCSFHLSSC